MTALFDPGLQPERTELAWRRTALSLGVGSLIALRLLPEILGSAVWALGGVIGLVVSAGIWVSARARLRAVIRALTVEPAPLPDGRMLFAVVVLVTVIGLTSAAVVGWALLHPQF